MGLKKTQESKLKKQARKLSIKEGAFATLRLSIGNSYISPFAIALNASNSLVALLTSIPNLLGPISQWRSSRLIEKHSRKKIAITGVFLEALFFIPLILIAVLFYKGIITFLLPILLIIVFSLRTIAAGIVSPAWFSWVGDIVDEKYRGKWFAKRNYIIGIVTIVSSILAAILLDYFKKNNQLMFGFMSLFAIVVVSRLTCVYYFKKSYEPKLKLKKGYYFSFTDFIKKASSNNFGKFTIFRSLLSLAASIASPFFAVYMLRNLGFSYVIFMTITLSQTLFSILALKIWGKFSDKFGNYEVLKITAVLIPLYPILWLISHHPLYLIFVPALIGGVAWAGFNLAAGNFIFDSVKKEKRSLAVSYHNLSHGIGMFLGATTGAVLARTLIITFMDKLLFIFLISAFARMLVSLFMIPLIREVRKRQKFDSSQALKHIVFKATHAPIFQGAHEIFVHKKHRFYK